MALKLVVWHKKSKIPYASKIKVLSPAKINLYLNLLGRYSNGFHKLESIVERISLCDEIEISQSPDKTAAIICNDKQLAGSDNLCIKAAQLMQKKFRLDYGFKINLTKKIPVGAGLGGGSSNAASVLIGINILAGLKLAKKELYSLGAKLGSDVNFFLSDSPYALMQGRGERITPFNGKKLKHTIIYPGVHLATKLVYQHTHFKLTKNLDNANMIKNGLKNGDKALVESATFNSLEKPALSLCVKIQDVKNYFAPKNIDFYVTGSGSALYSFSSINLFNGKLPGKWQVFEVDTF